MSPTGINYLDALLACPVACSVASLADSLHVQPVRAFVSMVVIVFLGLAPTVDAGNLVGPWQSSGGNSMIYRPHCFCLDRVAFPAPPSIPTVIFCASVSICHSGLRLSGMRTAAKRRRPPLAGYADFNAAARNTYRAQSIRFASVAVEHFTQFPRFAMPTPFLAICKMLLVCVNRDPALFRSRLNSARSVASHVHILPHRMPPDNTLNPIAWSH